MRWPDLRPTGVGVDAASAEDFCIACGNRLPERALICPRCGALNTRRAHGLSLYGFIVSPNPAFASFALLFGVVLAFSVYVFWWSLTPPRRTRAQG
ncbi:MAG: zinc ribbon domain-containing protein [Methanobacteriota archaeon]|nr:MAG: zinc ribbon domain-containing protein [Euryarchaeota archaeon]